MTEFILMAIVALVSGTLLTIKAKSMNDLSILGASVTRIYLAIMATCMVFGLVNMFSIFWAVLAVLAGDIANYIIFRYSKRYKKNELKNTTEKLLGIMNSSTVSLYTISLSGEIEYANPTMLKEFNECLVGRDFFAHFGIDKKEFLERLETKIVYNNKIYTVKGFRTKNGHETITGSIS